MESVTEQNIKLTSKDFSSDQEVKWCPGCGDYSILKQAQTIFPDINVPKENLVFISGIGCSSRFTYYMDTFGMHSIHGRAAAIASGVKAANPELSVWIVSGDGDSFSIGGNHLIHSLRKNFNFNYLVFNNQIYSLTKGQYSPTSEKSKITKSTPYGSIEDPFNPPELALGANAAFVSRTIDRDPKHMQMVLRRANDFKGTSFVEIYQNCPVFNDGAFFIFTEKETKKEEALFLEQGKPLIFGQNDEKGIMITDSFTCKIVNYKEEGIAPENLWIHDEKNKTKAFLLSQFVNMEQNGEMFPRPFGILYAVERPVYEESLISQINAIQAKKGKMTLDRILSGDKTWVIA
ncbi:MAG: 2-oxoacid:ferredoxin oxidoreductase subunit beta [Bacteroidetes bacterium]|nr:2-oxoacid:ferredoxin oxidoreductase subunit beta [Bacteroidota bacterium]